MIKNIGGIDKFFSVLLIFAVPVGLYFAFGYALTEKQMGIIQKIFYFHVASAWIGFFAFFITFVSSIAFLALKKYFFDDLAAASAEIGLIFCTVVIVTGPMWARPVWGAYWTWDPRLTTTLILWFIYIGYLTMRKFMEDADRKAKFSAAIGIIGFIDVPIVFLSIRWWNTIHPNVVQKGGGGLDATMKTAMFVCLGVFTVIYIALLVRKLRIINLEKRIDALEL